MSQNATGTKLWFSSALVFSFFIAFVGLLVPQRRMPIDFHMVLWLSLPLAGIWLAILIVSILRFHKKALWMLLGAPLALYWPLWLIDFRKTWLRGQRCLEDINNFWMAHKPQTMSEVYSHLHEELQLRLDEAKRVGYGFVLPASNNVSVVPIVPKLHQKSAVEIAA